MVVIPSCMRGFCFLLTIFLLLLLFLRYYFTIKASSSQRRGGDGKQHARRPAARKVASSACRNYIFFMHHSSLANKRLFRDSFVFPQPNVFDLQQHDYVHLHTIAYGGHGCGLGRSTKQYIHLLFHTYVSMMNIHEVKMVGLPRD